MGELPQGWIKSKLGDLLKLNNGFAFKSKDYSETGIPIIRMSDISNGEIVLDKAACVEELDEYERYVINKGDLLIGMSGSIGKFGIYNRDEKVYLNQRVGNLKLFSDDLINKRFIYYLVGNIQQKIVEKAYGGTVPNISAKDIEGTEILLPPLGEQKRMVAKLDVLFGELEALKGRLANIPELLKNFRQAVLTQAVTGKLTAEWSIGKDLGDVEINEVLNENYALADLPTNWKHSVISELGLVKGGKRLPKGEELVFEDTGFPYIRARDLKQGTVLTENMMFLNKSTQEQISRYIVLAGDLYITIVGAKIGDAGIIPLSMDGANLTENAAKITELNKGVFNEYLSLWLRSNICQQNIQKTIMSAAQGKLALTRIKELPVYIPSKEEQEEIVRRVEALFAQATAIETKYEALTEYITKLPQAILAKAFRGELVEQLDTDQPASELLEEIKALKEQLELEKKNARKKRKSKAV